MTIAIRALIALAILLALAAGLYGTSAFAGERKCFPLASLKLGYEIVLPGAQQIVLDKSQTKAYLDEFNSLPPETNHKARKILLVVRKNGSVAAIKIKRGEGCRPLFVRSKVHKKIMADIGLGES